MLKTAQIAPDFTLPSVGGPSVGGPSDDTADITLSELRPAPVVLFFYPRDDTPGCTLEARAFTDLTPEFKSLGAYVLGISKDSIAKHGKFRSKYDLAMPLLSDADNHTCEDYGVWGEKKMYGKVFMGITRTTVLIDATGKITRIWPKVKVEGHAEEVLEAVRHLQA
ncbi:MAG: peroxiredoxin [Marinosulfonomonas sp.]|nr:MAG: peroxiredoxin [Marinosulfonomonas sp.]